MRRWLTSAAAGDELLHQDQGQDLSRLDPTEKAAARSDLLLGLLIVDLLLLGLLYLAVRLGPLRSVRPRCLYLYHRRRALLCRRRVEVKMSAHFAEAEAEPEFEPEAAPVCACHCQVGRPPAPEPSA